MAGNTAPQSAVIYLSHGGGPLPLLGDAGHREMVEFLRQVTPRLGAPDAILLVSAHWEEPRPTITGNPAPRLIYDYYGFPDEAYRIRYPAPGSPQLAQRVWELLNGENLQPDLDDGRGFDHGLFIPLKIMYPDARIPCVQLSLLKSLDPDQHIRVGAALAALRAENILVIGSGFSFHNLRAFFAATVPDADDRNQAFENWLLECCSSSEIDEEERRQRLIHWQDAPGARFCHPREEHLLPLHVCYGIAGAPATATFSFTVMGKRASAYLWQ